MSAKPTSLMTQYTEGCLVGQILQDMMIDYAAQANFDREMVDDVELLSGAGSWGKYSGERDDE